MLQQPKQKTKKQLLYDQILEDQHGIGDLKFYQGFFYYLPPDDNHWRRVELPVYVQKKYDEAIIGNDAKWLAMMLTSEGSPILENKTNDNYPIRTADGHDIKMLKNPDTGKYELVVWDYMTDFTPYNIPVKYDKDATGPTIDKFMASVVDPASSVENLYEILGEPLIRREHHSSKAHLLQGGQGTGKSTFLELFYPLYGECATNVPFKNIQQGKRCHALTYSLVNVDDDIDEKQYGDVKTIKQIVTRNKFSVDNLYSNKALEITPRFCNVFSCNKMPKMSSKGEEISIRFRTEKFLNTFRGTDKDDPDMPAKLRKELPYLLNRCIEGANRLLARGMKFQETANSNAFADEVEKQDTVRQFLEDYEDILDTLSTRQVFSKYVETSKDGSGWAVSRIEFCEKMKRLGYRAVRRSVNNIREYYWEKKGGSNEQS